jgi:UDP-N-acetylglucosamine acyltransferase|tara:strand:- start:1733 stop:2512 length:780 start_codon:yes stop_codon:yes gene_type:complete
MIHSTAIINSKARVEESVQIGAYAIIESGAIIAEDCKIGEHAQICGSVEIGKGTSIGRGSIIGSEPQDASFDPSNKSGVKIGEKNNIRELTTIHRSAKKGGWTQLGNENFLMTGSHVGHDVKMGDRNIIANNCLLGGHVIVGTGTFLGGGAAFHQFVHLGDLCLAQGNSTITKDIPPYCTASQKNRLVGLNTIGLRRAGMDPTTRSQIKNLYRAAFFSQTPFRAALNKINAGKLGKEALKMLEAMKNPSRKGTCFPKVQ